MNSVDEHESKIIARYFKEYIKISRNLADRSVKH